MRSLTTRQAASAAGFVGLAVLLIVCWFLWWSSPPQMGADEEVFKTVDALFTAVTARDEGLLGQCERRLHACKEAGKLPTEASDYLDGVIQKSRAGHWESAAGRLYEFMKAQRRERPHDHPSKSKKTRPNSGGK